MVDTAEDNFRIEVWDREEKTHLETICRTPDAVVSQAAWHAAIRRRPGMLLIHYNSRHVMEKIVTPGEVKVPPQTIIDGSIRAGRLAQLAHAACVVHDLLASCRGEARGSDPALRQGSSVQLGGARSFLHELQKGRTGSAGDTQHAAKLRVVVGAVDQCLEFRDDARAPGSRLLHLRHLAFEKTIVD
ncbi:hypothetical protein [Mesorhizobium jarvisii]|uniref:hypothetical protein n=1 Tax=Mesorhizobium jarvisii TaxID=1777867 RepID=UPI000AEBE52C|nr:MULTISPECIES: hypothetical protein [Mesorhizobium]